MKKTSRSSSHFNDAGERIRAERRIREMTQVEFSELLGISVSYLGALERGTRKVSRAVLSRLHQHLGLSYDYLLEGNTLSNASLRQFVRESSEDEALHNLNVILGACSKQEVEDCYDLVHTYLLHSRKRKSAQRHAVSYTSKHSK